MTAFEARGGAYEATFETCGLHLEVRQVLTPGFGSVPPDYVKYSDGGRRQASFGVPTNPGHSITPSRRHRQSGWVHPSILELGSPTT